MDCDITDFRLVYLIKCGILNKWGAGINIP